MRSSTPLLVVAFFAVNMMTAHADVYMMTPRGSNNRCDERNNDRQTERLFNSQNNSAGGYSIAPQMYYHAGSVLTVEWTNQHSCGEGHGNCNVVIKMACEDTMPGMRDGQSTNPNNNNGSECTNEINENNLNNPNIGQHETLENFQNCENYERNKGLFNADRNVNNNQGRQATRQDNNANNNRGFECGENRDYWPDWQPSPWKDLAVLTNNSTRCDYYQAESQNVKGRYRCNTAPFITEESCPAGQWVPVPAHNWPAPECVPAQWSKDNNLGNAKYDLPQHNVTIPNYAAATCVLTTTYNISTADYDPWNIFAESNGDASPVQDDPYMQFGDMVLRMAIDTDQFGRTFEDRSHVFEIREPYSLFGERVVNMHVRGKRGNIAQVRNCVEYDFSPSRPQMAIGDVLHLQWTGTDYNANNAGEGTARTDRSNVVQVANNDLGANHIMTLDEQTLFDDRNTAYDAAFIRQQDNVQCKPRDQLSDNDNTDQDADNCSKLNGAANGYYDVGPLTLNNTGYFVFMSTRNNNWSNRGQKTNIQVGFFNLQVFLKWLLIIGGIAAVSAAGLGVVAYQQRRGNMMNFPQVENIFRGKGGSKRGGSRGSGRGHSSHQSSRRSGHSKRRSGNSSRSQFGGNMI